MRFPEADLHIAKRCALSVVYSSHFFPHEELEDIGQQIASGKRAVLKPDMLPPEMMRIIVEQSREMKAMCERMAA